MDSAEVDISPASQAEAQSKPHSLVEPVPASEIAEDSTGSAQHTDGSITPGASSGEVQEGSAVLVKNEDSKKLKTTDADIVYEEEYWDSIAKEWRIRAQSNVSDKQDCVLRVLKRMPRDIDDEEATRVETKHSTLRTVLQVIFADTTQFAWGEKNEVDAEWFYWARPRLQELETELCATETSLTSSTELLSLVRTALKFSETHFAATISSRETTKDRSQVPSIRYNDLWTLFPPNALAATSDELLSHPRVVRVKAAQYLDAIDEWPDRFSVYCDFVEWNGHKYGLARAYAMIPTYSGARPLDELEITPLHLASNRNSISERILERSEHQVTLHGAMNELQQYTGHGFILNKEHKREKAHFRGNVMIDPSATLEAIPQELMPDFTSSTIQTTANCELAIDQPTGKVPSKESVLYKIESVLQATASPSYEAIIDTKRETHLDRQPTTGGCPELSNFQKLLLSGIVYGYSLSSRRWGGFEVSLVKNVEWSETAFDALVMDPHLKSQLRHLVQAYSKTGPAIDDFIKGKGRGLIGLLFGQPGLGKTFTAEAIAEMAHLPLISISAGALGANPTEIDQRLTEELELAARWKAVVLFDEADVFLAKRDPNSIERNAVVSVFLREVEYFSGIMLLTTNKQDDIDPAFRSRIHFCYEYPALDVQAREKIWKGFISKATRSGLLRVDIKSAGYEDLAQLEYNGRQIKNIMTMATMLARVRSPPVLTTKSILDVARTFQNWEDLYRPANRDSRPTMKATTAKESPFASTLVDSGDTFGLMVAYVLGWISLALLLVWGLVSGSGGELVRWLNTSRSSGTLIYAS